MFFLGLLIGMIAYITCGFVAARAMRSSLINAAISPEQERYLINSNGFYGSENQEQYGDWGYRDKPNGEMVLNRSKVVRDTRNTIFGWPYMIPIFVLSHSLNTAMDKVDPAVYDRVIKRNAELERQLGMSE